MLTLEQAINDLMDASRTIAEVAESESDEANRINAQNVADDCKQIAELLRELQERRKAPEIIRCKDCAKRYKYNCPFPFGMWDTTPADGYCYIAKRRADG